MSGIGIQKLTGTGTSSYQLLQKSVETLEAINKLSYPDIYRLAKMFAPDMTLEPVTKNWTLDFGGSPRTLDFGGRYFGYFTVTMGTWKVADSDNAYKTAFGRVYDNGEITADLLAGFHGNDILPIQSVGQKYTGFGTNMVFGSLQDNPEGYMHVAFIGFKLGNVAPPEPPEPSNDWQVGVVNTLDFEVTYTTVNETGTIPAGYSHLLVIPNGTDLQLSNVDNYGFSVDSPQLPNGTQQGGGYPITITQNSEFTVVPQRGDN